MSRNPNKHELYTLFVQSPDVDAEFLSKTFIKLRGRSAITLREDFCGTFALSCEWIRRDSKHRGIGIDIDPGPIQYGKTHNLTQLTQTQKQRLRILQGSVLDRKLPIADLICAMNFSYFIFKERAVLKSYFVNCLRRLKQDGVLMLDCFGGPACHKPNTERRKRKGMSYFWDQQSWDPILHHAHFAIHFETRSGKRIRNAFTYDWRLWTVPELRDILHEAGFKNTIVFWEGTDKNGLGNGRYRPVEKVTEKGVQSWVCYIAGLK